MRGKACCVGSVGGRSRRVQRRKRSIRRRIRSQEDQVPGDGATQVPSCQPRGENTRANGPEPHKPYSLSCQPRGENIQCGINRRLGVTSRCCCSWACKYARRSRAMSSPSSRPCAIKATRRPTSMRRARRRATCASSGSRGCSRSLFAQWTTHTDWAARSSP